MRGSAAVTAVVLAVSAFSTAAPATAPPPPSPHASTTSGQASGGARVQGIAVSSSTPCGWRASTTYRHVVWVWMENRSYASVVTRGSQVATYAARCGLATQYYAVT